jgi:hypothetical protein
MSNMLLVLIVSALPAIGWLVHDGQAWLECSVAIRHAED